MGRNRLTVLVGSKNPTKVNAVKDAFFEVFPEQFFSIKGIKVESNVSDQPMTNEETFNGAKNRVVNMESNNGDFYVDMKSLTIKNDKRFFLRLRDYKKIDKYGEKSNIIYFETDCKKFKTRFLRDMYFEEHMGMGKSKTLN